jgi:hypothetical protein
MTKNYHNCAKRDKHLPFDVFSGSSILYGCHVWHNCGSFFVIHSNESDVLAPGSIFEMLKKIG